MKTIRAKVTNGHIPEPARQHILDVISKFEGKVIEINIKPFRKLRSENQNRFYFGCIVPVVRAWFLDLGTNLDATECHEFIVRHVWKHTTSVILPDGTTFERCLSSTTLTTDQWEKMLDLTRAYFSEKGLILPLPH